VTYPKIVNGSHMKSGDKSSVSKIMVSLLQHYINRCPGSDIIHMELFGTHLVVLNSERASNDLLDKRSSIYSDRYVHV
jgi:FMN-dependent NADH-azoreductase